MKYSLNSWIKQMASSTVYTLSLTILAKKLSVSLIPMTKPVKDSLNVFLACSLPHIRAEPAPAIFLTMLLVRVAFSICYRCYLLWDSKLQRCTPPWLSYVLDHHHWWSFIMAQKIKPSLRTDCPPPSTLVSRKQLRAVSNSNSLRAVRVTSERE